MPVYLIATLCVAGGLALAGLLVLAVSVLRLLRRVKRLGEAAAPRLERIQEHGAELERKSAAVETGQAELQASVERLNASIGRARVLAAALEDLRSLIAIVTRARAFLAGP